MWKGAQAKSESSTFGAFKSFISEQFLGLCLPSGQSSCSVPSLVNLPLVPPLGACIPFSQDGSQSEGFWESKMHYGLELSPDFWHPRSLSAQESCLPCPTERGIGDPLILYSNRVFPLFVLATIITLTIAVTITLRSLLEAKTGYLPCFCCYFHFGGQTGGWL